MTKKLTKENFQKIGLFLIWVASLLWTAFRYYYSLNAENTIFYDSIQTFSAGISTIVANKLGTGLWNLFNNLKSEDKITVSELINNLSTAGDIANVVRAGRNEPDDESLNTSRQICDSTGQPTNLRITIPRAHLESVDRV